MNVRHAQLPPDGRGRERGRWGVRKRVTAAAVATLAVVLTIAGVVLLILLRASLLENARGLASQQLDSVIEQIGEVGS